MKIVKEKVNLVDTSFVEKYYPKEYIEYVRDGREHYKLLNYLSFLFKDETIVEIGTYKGISALALAHNSKNKIISYDIVDNYKSKYDELMAAYPNLSIRIEDILYSFNTECLCAPFLFIDVDPHNGDMEKEIVKALDDLCYDGFMVFDDIHLNDGMRNFWKWACDNYVTFDVSNVGHHSGTGIIDFSHKLEVV